MSEPRWLSHAQQVSWRSFLTGSQLFTAQLDKELKEAHGIGTAEYEILVRLSENPEHTLRMAVLAESTTMSRSRLTHSVARMQKRGLLCRIPIPEDGRGVNCTLTEDGWELLRRAAPDHVASVRIHLVDLLDADEMEILGRIFAKVTREISPETDPYGRMNVVPQGHSDTSPQGHSDIDDQESHD